MSDSAHDRLRYVFVDRPACPACGSVKLKTIRSKTRDDGSVTRTTRCQECDHRFFVILDSPCHDLANSHLSPVGFGHKYYPTPEVNP
jgi:hypothetical protein